MIGVEQQYSVTKLVIIIAEIETTISLRTFGLNNVEKHLASHAFFFLH